MDITSLRRNHKMLAVILIVALGATIGGSLAYAQTNGTTTPNSPINTQPQIQGSVNLQQMLLSSIQTKFTDAANSAAGAVTNGQVIAGGLTVIQGSVVYDFKVIDGKNIYSVIVDAGNGKVLNTSQGYPIKLSSLIGGGHHEMKGRFHMGGAWKAHLGTSGTTSQPSGSTNPTSNSSDLPNESQV